jgi:hypothetical protein
MSRQQKLFEHYTQSHFSVGLQRSICLPMISLSRRNSFRGRTGISFPDCSLKVSNTNINQFSREKTLCHEINPCAPHWQCGKVPSFHLGMGNRVTLTAGNILGLFPVSNQQHMVWVCKKYHAPLLSSLQLITGTKITNPNSMVNLTPHP